MRVWGRVTAQQQHDVLVKGAGMHVTSAMAMSMPGVGVSRGWEQVRGNRSVRSMSDFPALPLTRIPASRMHGGQSTRAVHHLARPFRNGIADDIMMIPGGHGVGPIALGVLARAGGGRGAWPLQHPLQTVRAAAQNGGASHRTSWSALAIWWQGVLARHGPAAQSAADRVRSQAIKLGSALPRQVGSGGATASFRRAQAVS